MTADGYGADGTQEPGEIREPGLRGLRPGLGDLVQINPALIPGVRGWHWMRVTKIRDPYAAPLDLAGYLLPREELGEQQPSPVYEVRVPEPDELVVVRGDGPGWSAPSGQRVPGPVEALLAPAEPRTDLPAAVGDALARPDAHRPGETGRPRWPG